MGVGTEEELDPEARARASWAWPERRAQSVTIKVGKEGPAAKPIAARPKGL